MLRRGLKIVSLNFGLKLKSLLPKKPIEKDVQSSDLIYSKPLDVKFSV